jgi:hypothetical protein
LLEKRRRAPIVCVAILALSTLLMLPAFGAPAPADDEGLLVAYPAVILEGSWPQRDFYDPYGPASVWTVAAGFELFGKSLTSERVVGLAYRLTIIAAAFLLALCWGLGAAVVGALIVACLLVGSVGAPASIGFWALALLGYALLTRALLGQARHGAAFASAGALLAASALMRIDFIPVVVLASIPCILVMRGADRKRFLIGVAVGLVPLVCQVAIAGPHGVWRSLRLGLGTRSHPARPPFASDLAELVAVYALATALLLAAGLLIERRARRDPEARVLLGGGLLGVGMVPFALTKLDAPHVVISAVAVFALLPVAAVVIARADLLRRPTTAHARTFALAAVTIVVFFAGAEAIRVPVYQQARSLFTGSHVASFRVTNAGRSFLLSEPQQAHDAQAIVTSVERIARPGESLFVGPQDLRTAGSSDVFLYFLLPALKPASYYMQVDPHTINEPSNRFVRELPRAQFLILKKTPPAPPSELGAPEANEIVAAHFCVDTTTPTYSLYSRCR